MALGESIGYATKLSQNNNALYYHGYFNASVRKIHIALMGDPTLRMHVVKPPSNLTADSISNVTVIKGNLESIEAHKDLFKKIDHVVHTATCWGGTEAAVIDFPLKILNYLDQQRVKKIIFFSTASILGPDHQILREAEQIGTNYIRSKYLSYAKIKESKLSDRVLHIFPTVILGGDRNHPYSDFPIALICAM